MQHLEEGTIHSWLDGALAPGEAARVEIHVADCPECASAVAEARGFIAASSRILTKLDDVPSGVVPVAHPVRRRITPPWRAAAAVLVVAVGSLMVFRNRGGEQTPVTSQRAVVAERGLSDTGPAVVGYKSAKPTLDVAPARTSAPPAVAKAVPAPPRDEKRADGGAITGAIAEGAQANAAVAPAAPFAVDAMAEPPLRLVREEKVPGGKQTSYAVTAADTVTLFEPAVADLQNMVTTSATGASARRAVAAPTVSSEMSAQASTVAADTAALLGRAGSAVAQSRSAKSATAAPSLPPTNQTRPLRTITWMETTSGRMLTLSGRLPVEQLQEIKRRIERERATAAAARKPPQ